MSEIVDIRDEDFSGASPESPLPEEFGRDEPTVKEAYPPIVRGVCRSDGHDTNIAAELLRFRPLVLATAKRYAGRGAEFDDLVQEGYAALLELIPRCPRRDLLPLFLKSRLPGRVRAAARRFWRSAEHHGFEPLDELEGTPFEPSVPPVETDDGVSRLLSPEELRMARMLAEGWSQKETAKCLGVTQQTISFRLRRLRERLRGFE